ncbi:MULTISPECIES: dUTP diphosphatase [Brochothrix]|mgnify:CR=1 FL=1|uniref:dUTP diphosphatase n=1 Tax=Brochothrix thermosphacta TaxID=2756 RepID=A0A1D2K4F2_BROTH|nr:MULTISPECIES: dUTP diphosphatase [Brochothrix]SLM93274.1 Deoxyuridine 5'-triphosphate nucleotidohydrolase [Brachybacterium faecium]ANZ95733.1 dUTPase [Brochothrix thermosphacta]ATF25415.1 dUTPase [Brochothrix thermosphacta]ATH84746.1 dUTPase [Brochothrix thermosphacta]MBR5527301.1 dUTP diphosphatase [Brochothrix sp.]
MKTRGFEAVPTQNRKYPEVTIKLPVRADSRSAGYDFSSNETATIAPGQKHLFWTDVCSYMLADEVLEIYVRSSIGIKKNLTMANTVGIIDSSYYANEGNYGNIGICLVNHSEETVTIEAGERIAQGIFKKYLVADEDVTLNTTRSGGMGSSGSK